MTGVAVKGKDRAGGKQDQQANDWFRLDGDPVVTLGDTVEAHDPHGPATMVEGEDWFRVGGRPVCRAENKSSCGHATTGRQWFRLIAKNSPYRDYIENPSDPCNIEHIPWIMRANGWHEGAKLMDQWFERDPSDVKVPKDSDTTSITMDLCWSSMRRKSRMIRASHVAGSTTSRFEIGGHRTTRAVTTSYIQI